ncbi:MAG: glycosyltransferase [Woeseiaceae bacterium]
MIKSIKRWCAILLLTIAYGSVILLARICGSPVAAKRAAKSRRLLVVGTFHNPNWFYAHLEPLARCSSSEVFLIADGHTGNIRGLRVITPHPLAARVLSRAGAKSLWAFWYAIKLRPDLYMGYAIFPAATTALLLGRIFRRPACFQVTSGPLELAGGGFHAENPVLAALGRPSGWIERLAFELTRHFELVVVRGDQAEKYIRGFGADNRIISITGSVEMPAEVPDIVSRPLDIVFVGRLTKRKRPDRFVAAVKGVTAKIPQVRASIVGDGPEMDTLRQQISELGLEANIELLGLRHDVLELLKDAKIFALTSRWEGVSIAMLEAMASGTIPVVSDVGDVRDVVSSGENGVVLDENDIDGFANNIADLLKNNDKLTRLSNAARMTVLSRNSRAAVTEKWTRTLRSIDAIEDAVDPA